MKKDLSLKEIGLLLWNNIAILLIVTIVGGIIGFAYSHFTLNPYYVANTTLIVNSINKQPTAQNGDTSSQPVSTQQQQQITTAEQNSASTLLATYSVIVKSQSLCAEVSARLADQGLYYSAGGLQGMISVTQVDETQVMRITVRGGNAKDVAVIANTFSATAVELLPEKIIGGHVVPLDAATKPSAPAGPNKTIYIVEGMLICACLAFAVIFLIYMLDTKIKNEDDLHQMCNIPVIGTIPHVGQ